MEELLHGFTIRDPVFVFGLTLAVILAVPLVLKRLRLPGIVGLILAGVVLGPHALDLIPEESVVQPIGAMGLLYLMFLAGIEVDMQRFRRQRHVSAVFGGVTFAIPQILGTLGAVFLLRLSWPAAILMASMFASHTLVPYSIVQRLGLVKERVVTTAVGGTVLTDSLALLVLAVVAESTIGDLTPVFWVRLVVLLAVYVGLIVLLLPRLGRWFFGRVSSESVAGFVFVLAAAFACASAAPLAGLEPIIGAFLAGLALNTLIPEQSRIMARLRFVGESIFIPFFLVSVGLRVDVGLLSGSGRAWAVMGFMVATATATKLAAAAASGRALGLSRDETGLLFGLSVNQAAATLAGVVVGVRLGIFSAEVLNGTILMILATCTLGPWLTERYGRRLALRLSRSSLESSGGPERIMVPMSASEQIEPLMSLALMVRSPRSSQPVYPAMIIPGQADETEKAVAQAERMLADAVILAVEADTPVRPVTRIAPVAAAGVLGASADLRISTIVMDETFTGEGELEHAPSRIVESGRHLVLRFRRPRPLNTSRRILAAVPPLMERQPGFSAAWEVVRRIAGQAGTGIMLLAGRATLEQMVRRKLLDPGDPGTETGQVDDWHDLSDEIRSRFVDGDLPVLFMARRGRLSWQPVQDRLPAMLQRSLPDVSILKVFPPEMKWETEERSGPRSGSFEEVFTPETVHLGMSNATLPDAMESMLAASLGAPPADLVDDLHEQLRESALRLAPGCVLVHTHKAGPPAPMVLMGTAAGGFSCPGGGDAECPSVLIILLGTPDESPEDHLRRLARIARIFHDRELLERIRSAKTYGEVLPSRPPGFEQG